MRFTQSSLSGVWLIHPDAIHDERGYFARTFCDREFASQGLENRFVQSSTAQTHAQGTLRGLHFQLDPHWETKLIRCTSGSAYIVVVDLRSDSSNYKQWLGFELSRQCGTSLYVPVGFAQGYQTLVADTEILYLMSKHYHPESASGYCYNDPAFGIEWPMEPKFVSEQDRSWSRFNR